MTPPGPAGIDRLSWTDEVVETMDDLLGAIPNEPRPTVRDLPFLPYKVIRRADPEIVPMICRLLLRLGDVVSLQIALRLSFMAYDSERERGERHAVSTMLRGLAQMGLGQAALGTKNLVRVRSVADSLHSWDRMCIPWGMLSGAIALQDLRLAARFAVEWRELALAGGYLNETARAELTLELLRRLDDTGAGAIVGEGGDAREVPESLRGQYLLLRSWGMALGGTQDAVYADLENWPQELRGTEFYACALAMTSQQSLEDRFEPAARRAVPLLLGEDWCDPAPVTAESMGAPDFATLCRGRRSYAHPSRLESMNPTDLRTMAQGLSQWGLAAPLHAVERRLSNVSSPSFYKLLMERSQGRHASKLLQSEHRIAGRPQRREEAVIWMTDVAGYSSLGESVDPEVLFEMLSPLYRILNEELETVGGMILEFVGDSIMVVFNLFPEQRSSPAEVLQATARALQRLHQLGALRSITGTPELRIGVGIQRGQVALGFLGGLRRCHLAALGNTVNVASRIEGLTRSLPCPVAVESGFFEGGFPNVWSDPAPINFSLRDLGDHPLKNIARPAHVFGLSPLIPYWTDFVPMGFVAVPEPGIVYLDVGNRCCPGIVDHHVPSSGALSACSLVNHHPELVLEHLGDVPTAEIELRMHQDPDLDCAAAFYSAVEQLGGRPRKEVLSALSLYVDAVDQGFLPEPEHYRDSLYGVFVAHQHLVRRHQSQGVPDHQLLEAGLRVVDAACLLAEAEGAGANFAQIFATRPEWFAKERLWLQEDREQYEADRRTSIVYQAPVGGLNGPGDWLWLENPRSILFKHWARTDPTAPGGRGYPCLAVDWSDSRKNRLVLSVDPGTSLHLAGLGQCLEKAEAEKRRALGEERPLEPRRYPADNSDPWYFGLGHHYTIVDSPACGTVLTPEEVRTLQAGWKPDELS